MFILQIKKKYDRRKETGRRTDGQTDGQTDRQTLLKKPFLNLENHLPFRKEYDKDENEKIISVTPSPRLKMSPLI